jgi:uroporphyrinogen decarboxylase
VSTELYLYPLIIFNKEKAMTHKERFLMAIQHEEPDRVPIDVWYTPEAEKKMLKHLGEKTEKLSLYAADGGYLPHLMGHDFLITWIGPCTSYYMKDTEEYYDEWGIKWRWVDTKSGNRYTEMVEHPLANIDDPDQFTMPDFKNMERYKASKKMIEKHGKEYGIMGGIACSLFELSWYLRGMEKVLEDMVLRKDFLHTYLDKLLGWLWDAGTILVKLGVDVIWIGDDFGSQDRLLISPALFREFFKPRYARLFSHLRSLNPHIKFAFHTDGNNWPIIQDFIDAGVNILNPVQPKSMDPAELKKKFGKKLTLWGTIDNQETMPFGSVEDVIEETKLRLKTVAPGGGLLLGPSHNVQPQVPIENIMAFYETVKKFGTYPIRL